MSTVKEYYDEIAGIYDHDRFGNSYGKFIDAQEQQLLKKWLKNIPLQKILDYGCGTGRLTLFAGSGADISKNMLRIAQEKYPEKSFHLIQQNESAFSHYSFNAIFSFHVIMHLSNEELQQMLQQAHLLLDKKGIFIFDILSTKRKSKKSGWHANNSYNREELTALTKDTFDIISYQGILFLPIHRIPSGLRKYFVWLDNILCNSFLKKYASYYAVIARKK